MIEQQLVREMGRIVSNGYYDVQQLRISMLNRIRDVIRKKKEGIPFDQKEEKKDTEKKEAQYTDKELMKYLQSELKNGNLSEEELNYLEKCIVISREMASIEAKYKIAMMDFVKREPIYNLFLEKIGGIGTVLSANLIREFGYCEKYETVSKLWANAGQGVVGGIAVRKQKGQELHYSPRLKVLVWKVSDCLLKSNHGLYRQIYDTKKQFHEAKIYPKEELEQKYGKPYTAKDTKLRPLHLHNRALRDMRKMFLSHYWSCARELAGLPTRELYVVEKLGHKNIIPWRKAVEMEPKKIEKVKKDKIKAPKQKKVKPK